MYAATFTSTIALLSAIASAAPIVSRQSASAQTVIANGSPVPVENVGNGFDSCLTSLIANLDAETVPLLVETTDGSGNCQIQIEFNQNGLGTVAVNPVDLISILSSLVAPEIAGQKDTNFAVTQAITVGNDAATITTSLVGSAARKLAVRNDVLDVTAIGSPIPVENLGGDFDGCLISLIGDIKSVSGNSVNIPLLVETSEAGSNEQCQITVELNEGGNVEADAEQLENILSSLVAPVTAGQADKNFAVTQEIAIGDYLALITTSLK